MAGINKSGLAGTYAIQLDMSKLTTKKKNKRKKSGRKLKAGEEKDHTPEEDSKLKRETSKVKCFG
jgi:hypothetical protein